MSCADPRELPELIAPGALAGALPADVPLTLESGERIGTANLREIPGGIEVVVEPTTAQPGVLACLTAGLGPMSFTSRPDGSQRVTLPMTLRRDTRGLPMRMHICIPGS